MKNFLVFRLAAVLMLLFFVGILPGEVLANGNERLGPPSIPIASGSNILAAGTGMLSQPGTIDIYIPSGVTIKQVLLYWQGIGNPDNTIIVEGTKITGSRIGRAGPDRKRFCYRADITAFEFVRRGSNRLAVSDLLFDVNNGAGVLVIIDDGFNAAEIDLLDGDDFAYAPLNRPYDRTVPQTFYFTPENIDRTATLSMFFASVSGPASDPPSGGVFRPTAIEVTVDETKTVYNDRLDSLDGDEWDTLVLDVDIPAHADSLTVRALSVDNRGGKRGNPASFDWLTAALSMPIVEDCKGVRSPGYWTNHRNAWPEIPFCLPGYDEYDENGEFCFWPEDISSGGGNKCDTMIRQIVAAELNIATSDCDYYCIDDTLNKAEKWYKKNCSYGNKVEASSKAWKYGEPLSWKLDEYNNGRLCAPKEEDSDKKMKKKKKKKSDKKKKKKKKKYKEPDRKKNKCKIPPGHLPPPGKCRIWYPGLPPGHQPPPGKYEELKHRVPHDACLICR